MMIDEEKIIKTIKKDYTSFQKLPEHYYTQNILMAYFYELLFRVDKSPVFALNLFHNLELYHKHLSLENLKTILSKINRKLITEKSFEFIESNELKVLLCVEEISLYPFLKPKGYHVEELYFEWLMQH